jgi:hypothetical protein
MMYKIILKLFLLSIISSMISTKAANSFASLPPSDEIYTYPSRQDFLNANSDDLVLVLEDDGDGSVEQYLQAIKKYKNRQVEIAGICKSACLLAFSHPNICLHKNAKILINLSDPKFNEIIKHLPIKLTSTINDQAYTSNGSAKIDQDFLKNTGIRECGTLQYGDKLF